MNPENVAQHESIDTSDRPARSARRASPAGEDQTPVRVRMKHGTYVGLGCPDPDQRYREDDVGSGYTHDHPARSVYRESTVTDPNTGARRTVDAYVTGEIVQLYPLPEHEQDAAGEIRAKNKRFTFSRKEAERYAQRMIDDGIAERVS